jgi:SAM-dependent methyltransferase
MPDSPTTISGTSGRIREIGAAFMSSRVLHSAVELDVFTHLADGPLTAPQLAERLGLHARGTADFFDTLVALGLLERHGAAYRNSNESDRLLDRRKPTSIAAAIELNSRMYDQWTHLVAALKTGKPQPQWTDRWAERYSDDEYLRVMREAMTIQSLRWAGKLAKAFPWSDYASFADLGCAEGAVAVAIANAHPEIVGVGVDLPALEPHFDRYVAAHGFGERLRFQGGDLFRDPLPGVEVLVLSGVLHSWSSVDGQWLLQKAFDALPPGGALVVRDGFLDDERKQPMPLLFSLHMLVDSEHGRGFEHEECQGWLRKAGFRDVTVQELDAVNAIVIGRKE